MFLCLTPDKYSFVFWLFCFLYLDVFRPFITRLTMRTLDPVGDLKTTDSVVRGTEWLRVPATQRWWMLDQNWYRRNFLLFLKLPFLWTFSPFFSSFLFCRLTSPGKVSCFVERNRSHIQPPHLPILTVDFFVFSPPLWPSTFNSGVLYSDNYDSHTFTSNLILYWVSWILTTTLSHYSGIVKVGVLRKNYIKHKCTEILSVCVKSR